MGRADLLAGKNKRRDSGHVTLTLILILKVVHCNCIYLYIFVSSDSLAK